MSSEIERERERLLKLKTDRKGSPLRKQPGSTLNTRPRIPTQQLMQEMSETILIQNEMLVEELDVLVKTIHESGRTNDANLLMSERIHDRLESLSLEQRATNMLLSQLVAIHSAVMPDDQSQQINQDAENIRMNIYDRVLRAE